MKAPKITLPKSFRMLARIANKKPEKLATKYLKRLSRELLTSLVSPHARQ